MRGEIKLNNNRYSKETTDTQQRKEEIVVQKEQSKIYAKTGEQKEQRKNYAGSLLKCKQQSTVTKRVEYTDLYLLFHKQ